MWVSNESAQPVEYNVLYKIQIQDGGLNKMADNLGLSIPSTWVSNERSQQVEYNLLCKIEI